MSLCGMSLHREMNIGKRWVSGVLPGVITVLIITLMASLSEMIREPEIIFPEIAAIATGAILAPRFTWVTSKRLMFFYIVFGAVLGMLIVAICPGPIWGQLMLAFLVSQVMLYFSRTSFAPMVSAVVLPVLLQTKTLVFLLSTILFTAVILLLRESLENMKLRPEESHELLEMQSPLKSWIQMGKRMVVVFPLILLAILLNVRFLIAPPLLVAFTEFSNPQSKARKQPVKTVAMLAICSSLGTIFRYVLVLQLKLPLGVAAFAASICVVLLIYKTRIFLPPAAALMLLAMLVPVGVLLWYPLEVLVGAAALMFLSDRWFHDDEKWSFFAKYKLEEQKEES